MTPQERDLITTLLARLRTAGAAGQQKDPEADALIRQALREQPDMAYFLVQTVLIQDLSLTQAQNRIAELEQQVAEAGQRSPGSFLGGLFGQREPSPPPARSAGPWSRGPQTAQQPGSGYGQPGYGQPPGYPPQGYAQQQQPGGMMGGGGGFLRSAAATAAGVAGGALLFQGISSMFGGGFANSLYSGGSGESQGLGESVGANSGGDFGGGDAGYAGGGPDDYGADYSGGDDFGGGDFGGGDDL